MTAAIEHDGNQRQNEAFDCELITGKVPGSDWWLGFVLPELVLCSGLNPGEKLTKQRLPLEAEEITCLSFL